MKRTIQLLQEFSIPLIAGVLAALAWANLSPETYHSFIHKELFEGVNFHFLVNDIFMVFFFATAAVEITQALLPGGDLNPIKKAINPLFATIGGVVGPAVVYLGLNALIGAPEYVRGWGIPTATDIALAWLVARFVFGAAHPAVNFLLLLAVADDAIGLIIIAVFYPDPINPVIPGMLIFVLLGMVAAFLLRRFKVQNYWPYIIIGGVLSWYGLYSAHLHVALALVPIIPFLPVDQRETAHIFEADIHEHSTLTRFEHDWRIFIDFGLFFFGLSNAGVQFSEFGVPTWLVFCALLFGKTIGITLLGILARLMGFPLPNDMGLKELFTAGIVAAVGLTVALFMATAAFVDLNIQGAAKMGALLSALIAVIAVAFGRVLHIKRIE